MKFGGVVVVGRVERFCMRVKRRERGKIKMILGVCEECETGGMGGFCLVVDEFFK